MEIIKRFFQPIILVNFIFICLCVSGFIYQVYLIFDQYMLGKTIVNLEVKLLKNQPLPAITLCVPHLLSIPKLEKLTSFSQNLIQDYNNLLNQCYTNKSFPEWSKKRLNDIYRKIVFLN